MDRRSGHWGGRALHGCSSRGCTWRGTTRDPGHTLRGRGEPVCVVDAAGIRFGKPFPAVDGQLADVPVPGLERLGRRRIRDRPLDARPYLVHLRGAGDLVGGFEFLPLIGPAKARQQLLQQMPRVRSRRAGRPDRAPRRSPGLRRSARPGCRQRPSVPGSRASARPLWGAGSSGQVKGRVPGLRRAASALPPPRLRPASAPRGQHHQRGDPAVGRRLGSGARTRRRGRPDPVRVRRTEQAGPAPVRQGVKPSCGRA